MTVSEHVDAVCISYWRKISNRYILAFYSLGYILIIGRLIQSIKYRLLNPIKSNQRVFLIFLFMFLSFTARIASFITVQLDSFETDIKFQIVDNLGILMYYTMMTFFTLAWFEAYQKLMIPEEYFAGYKKRIINMKILFWILNTIQYTTYLSYLFIFYKEGVYVLQILVFVLTFFPDPIILCYYGYKLIDILAYLTTITNEPRDLIRVRRLKIIRNALVGFGIYRIIIWGY